MKNLELAQIANVLEALSTPGMKPKDLLKAAQKRFPDANKKDIVRGAFLALIMQASDDPEKAKRLQDFALSSRGADGGGRGDASAPGGSRKKNRGK